MKKIIILFFVSMICFNGFSKGKAKSKEKLIKRTISILPFYNQNNIAEFDYLASSIRDALLAELIPYNLFLFTDFSAINDIIGELDLSIEESLQNDNAQKIAYITKSDVVITGKYIIIEDNIKILIQAIDIFTEQIVASTNLSGELGLDVFRIIDESTKDLADKVVQKLKRVDKSYFDEMIKTRKKLDRSNTFIRFRPIKDINLTKKNKMGIIFTIVGTTLLLYAIPVISVDMAVYYPKLQNYVTNGIPDSSYFPDFQNTQGIFIGFFASTIAAAVIGIAFISVGIPFIVMKNKQTACSFHIEGGSMVSIYFQYKFPL